MNLSPALSTASAQTLIGPADVLDAEQAVADQHWAAAMVNSNPAFRWIVAKYVEGNKPNKNNHLWAAEDLAASVDTVQYAPMNMLHEQNHIVGSFTGSKFMKAEPHGSLDPSTAQQQADQNPYIEVVGPFWRYYFPNELATVEKAFAEGSLFISMECVAETARWHNQNGETKDFQYMGPSDASYGEWQKQGNILQFVKPHFVGGGLIVPPKKPGWGGAEVKQIAELVEEYQQESEDVYEAIAAAAPHLDPKVWEELMFVTMKSYKNSGIV